MNDGYNGHESWEHWNVALWLYIDEGLYGETMRSVRRTRNADDGAAMLVDSLREVGITHTPDGAEYTQDAVRAAIAEEYERGRGMKVEITDILPEFERMVEGYVTCALWASLDDDGESLDSYLDATDISEAARAIMRAECADFVEYLHNADDDRLADYLAQCTESDLGHDFWLTRNRHGAGFWNRGLPGDLGKRLTDDAHSFGSSDLYVGDDGQIHVGG